MDEYVRIIIPSIERLGQGETQFRFDARLIGKAALQLAGHPLKCRTAIGVRRRVNIGTVSLEDLIGQELLDRHRDRRLLVGPLLGATGPHRLPGADRRTQN